MSDYISREDAVRAFTQTIAKRDGEHFMRAPYLFCDEVKQTIEEIPAADVLRDLKDCRNELCLYCGKYREQHRGACDGCRWQKGVWNT